MLLCLRVLLNDAVVAAMLLTLETDPTQPSSSLLPQVGITVVPVPDSPEVTLPANPTVMEDNLLSLRGLGMYDADVSRPGDEGISFTVWLEAVAGRISLNNSAVSFFFSFSEYDLNIILA